MMTPNDLRKSYIDFNVRLGSAEIPSASLIPENDSSTLFTGSGMQPMLPYLLGEEHPVGCDLVNIQRCVRTGDIEEVGDDSHLTYFEMIGRWQLGGDPGLIKEEQIQRIFEWQVDTLGLDVNRLYVSVFKGADAYGIAVDSTAIEIWTKLFRSRGVEPIIENDPNRNGASKGGRIFVYDASENWWSRAGKPDNMPVGEPGGPDSEMFYDFDPSGDPLDHPANDTSRFVEIGNNVFMFFRKVSDDTFEELEKPNIDYGGGFERISSALNGNPDIYLTPFFGEALALLERLSGLAYRDDLRSFRIVLDHIRASTFLVADGAVPSNTDAGYITRRLLRRAIRVGIKLGLKPGFTSELSKIFLLESKTYNFGQEKQKQILETILNEENQFFKTILLGEREIGKFLDRTGSVTGVDAFNFFQTYGFPKELTEEFLREKGETIDQPEGFEAAANEHSQKSKTASVGKFRGGLSDILRVSENPNFWLTFFRRWIHVF